MLPSCRERQLPVTTALFTADAIGCALAEPGVAQVDLIERFFASAAEVARLSVRFSDGRAPRTVIGKAASGAGLAAAQRERPVPGRVPA